MIKEKKARDADAPLEAIATAAAHTVAAEFARMGGCLTRSIEATAECRGVVITVRMSEKAEASCRLLRFEPDDGALEGLRKEIWDAAPAAGARPITARTLARRTASGYGYNTHFLKAVRELVRDRFLERVEGGLRRKATP